MVHSIKCGLLSSLLCLVLAQTMSATSSTGPTFGSVLIGGSVNVTVYGESDDSVIVRSFPAGFMPLDPTSCEKDLGMGTILSVVPKTGTTAQQATLSGTPPYAITLAQPLVAGTLLCIEETSTPATYSKYQTVTDPGDNGRIRLNFTGGTMISNQQTGGQSSTAATYLDLGFSFTLMRAGGSAIPPRRKTTVVDGTKTITMIPAKPYHAWQPGIENFINLRMTPVPVATKTTTTTIATPAGSNTGTSTTSTNPNMLTSQQSALVFGGFDFPVRLTRWDNNSKAFFVAPLIKSGFATLLNPSVNNASTTSTTGSTTPTTINTSTAATFNSVYWYNATGLRFGAAQYPTSTDKAPIPFAQFDMTVGHYSNLPSIVCNPATTTTTKTQPTNTSCYTTTTTTTGGTTATTYLVQGTSRTLIPRLQLAGFIQIPNYPFVLGVDANLAEYAFGSHVNKIDSHNKPGNDVRIYVGVTLDPVSAFKKLGLTP